MSQINLEGSTGTGAGSYLINNVPTKILGINNFRAMLEIQNQDSSNYVRVVALPISVTTPPGSAPAAPIAGTPTTVASVLLAPGQTWSPNSEQVPENAFYAFTTGSSTTAIISILEG